MKRKEIFSILLILVISILSLGCQSKEKAQEDPVQLIEQEQDKKEKSNDLNLEEAEDEEDKEDKEQVKEDQEEVLMQRVGEKGIGFISIPEDWVEFVDLNVNDSIQYSNILGTSIISLNTFYISSLSEEEQAEFTLEDAANSLWYNLENSGVENIEGAIVELDQREAYQVYGYFTSQDYNLPSIIITWLLEGDDGNIHYVAAEAAVEDIDQVFDYVEDNYSVNE
ncbi:MAG: hypothetical protein GX079_04125 [Tissierellia bacterium]|nr:hypothetical protein [Tissierellia bacterium]